MYLDKIYEQEQKKRLAEGFSGINPFSLIPMIFEVLIAAMLFLAEFPKRINYLIKSLEMVGRGMFGEVIAVADNTPKLMNETVKMITCGITRITKFKPCMIYYFLDFVSSFCYAITVRLIVFLVGLLSLGILDLQPLVDGFWEIVEQIDEAIHETAGFHIAHYPDSVIAECYSCDMVDTTVVSNALRDLGAPAAQIINGAITFLSVFTGRRPNSYTPEASSAAGSTLGSTGMADANPSLMVDRLWAYINE
jgi:hypothetical protein